jgi:thioredoxin-related protein
LAQLHALNEPIKGVTKQARVSFAIAEIDDTPRRRGVEHPPWFKHSFLDLREDLREALDRGKLGLIVYFGQEDCAYCEALMQVNWGREADIVAYTRKHFDVVAIDIWGAREVTDMQGRVLTEREFAVREGTNFTPSLIFYDGWGREALRLRGYYPPYKFRGALEYVVDGFYLTESLRDYMARADPPPKFDIGDLNDEPFFDPPPYALCRRRFPAARPLVVFFEQRECHACDILHSEPLQDETTQALLGRFQVVQLDMWSDTPVITPGGARVTAREWARRLGLFYAPSLVFFDEEGREVFRLDSVARLYRLRNTLRYVLEKGYLEAPLQRWQEDRQRREQDMQKARRTPPAGP